jgi:hypothetical protein
MMIFLASQHQAMLLLILHGILFGTFAVVFVGHFLKTTKFVLFFNLSSFLRELCVLVVQFSLFLARQLFCEADSTAQTTKASF